MFEFYKIVTTKLDYLKVKSDKIDDYVKYINDNNILRILLNQSFDFLIDNVDFLKDCPNVEEVFPTCRKFNAV